MNFKLQLIAFSAIACACWTIFAQVHATELNIDQTKAVTWAKVSLTQAIRVATQRVGGTASSAKYEIENGHEMYEVLVIKDDSVIEVEIDPTSGRVIGVEFNEENESQADD